MATKVGASSTYDNKHWHQVDWTKCHAHVARLQARIVKATQEGRTGKVKALQWLLTHSFSAKATAVKRVTENKGRNTPGVDGKTLSTPLEKSQAIGRLQRRGYQPGPVKRIYLPKATGKNRFRPLGIPQIDDRSMQALHLQALDPVAETRADPTSFGFRARRRTADAIAQCFIVLSSSTKASWVLEGDIESCFDHLSHQWLLDHVPMDQQVLGKWLKAGIVEKAQYIPSIQGSPQGGIISPVLANLALDGMDKLLKECPELKGRKVNLVRYADDFIITGQDAEVLQEKVRPKIEAFLTERGLRLSKSKTKITHIEEGFDFLGQNIRKYNGKLLITPSGGSCKRLIKKVKACIRKHRGKNAYQLVKKLNPIIRGWAYYHRHVVSKATFKKMDSIIFYQLWRWVRRRHPNKPRRWAKTRYFSPGKDWGRFRGSKQLPNGRTETILLEQAGRIPIKRHVKVLGKANPYAHEDQAYFEKRQARQELDHIPKKGFFQTAWRRQEGKCLLCKGAITEATHWHLHHLLPKKDGGKDTPSNVALLHPNCHRQLHSNEEVARSIGSKIGRIVA